MIFNPKTVYLQQSLFIYGLFLIFYSTYLDRAIYAGPLCGLAIRHSTAVVFFIYAILTFGNILLLWLRFSAAIILMISICLATSVQILTDPYAKFNIGFGLGLYGSYSLPSTFFCLLFNLGLLGWGMKILFWDKQKYLKITGTH